MDPDKNSSTGFYDLLLAGLSILSMLLNFLLKAHELFAAPPIVDRVGHGSKTARIFQVFRNRVEIASK